MDFIHQKKYSSLQKERFPLQQGFLSVWWTQARGQSPDLENWLHNLFITYFRRLADGNRRVIAGFGNWSARERKPLYNGNTL